MNLSSIPKPLLVAFGLISLLIIGYVTFIQLVNQGTTPVPPGEKNSSVKVSVFDENTQNPIVGAKVIMESETGSDSDTTDNNGVFQINIPNTDSVRIRISKQGCDPYNQNLNLQSNPNRPKQILLTCSTSKPSPSFSSQSSSPSSSLQPSRTPNTQIPNVGIVDWGNLPKYFFIEDVETKSEGFGLTTLIFITEAKSSFNISTVEATMYDLQRVKSGTRFVNLTPRTSAFPDKWNQGERRRASVTLPPNISKVEFTLIE